MHKWMDSGKNEELTDLEVDPEMELEDDWRVAQEHIIGARIEDEEFPNDRILIEGNVHLLDRCR